VRDGRAYAANVPVRWYFVGAGWLASVPIRLEKEGYVPVDTYLHPPVDRMDQPSKWHDGSAFGRGKTADVRIELTPLSNP